MPSVVPLDYGNTTLYSGVLLDSYMEYKHIVKKLNQSTLPGPYKPAILILTAVIETLHLSKYQEAPECSHEETIEGLKPIRLTYSELEDAKNHCRSQMMRILKEVDLISQNPDLAINEDHEQPFDSSELFATMLPVCPPLSAHRTPPS